MYVLKKFCDIIAKSYRENARRTGNDITDNPAMDNKLENAEEAVENVILPFVDNENEKPPDEIDIEPSVPHIFVEAKLLKQFGINSNNENRIGGIVYEINGEIFWDDTNINTVDKLLEFEIKELITDQNDLEADIEVKQVKKDDSLPIAIENTPYGLMINSIILLTENAWNTIVCGEITCCIVCNRDLDIREIAGHIATDGHKRTLEKFKPLMEFDINIVRKINNKYHCAICNITFDIEDIDHIESSAHGEKVLKAVNKASDLTDYDNDFGSHNEFDDSRNGNRNADNDTPSVAEDNSGIDMQSFDGFYDNVSVSYCSDGEDKEINQENVFSYADIAKKPKAYIIPKYVQIKLGDNYAKVKFDSWHMIIVLKTNNFYCMSCKETGPIRFKSNHCMSLTHVEKLMKCNIVREHKDHVIRKVDDKLYHCGHCNNLHMIHEIRDHIESYHMKRTGNRTPTEKAPLTKCTVIRSASQSTKVNENQNTSLKSFTPSHVENNDRSIVGNRSNENNNDIKMTVNNKDSKVTNISANQTQNPAEIKTVDTRNMNNEQRIPMPFVPYNQMNVQPYGHVQMDSRITIMQFGLTYCVSLMAYNTIQQRRPNAYFCWVCDVWCINVRNHISDKIHVSRLAQTFFLPEANLHLIRQIKHGFHCVVCNMLLQQNPILHTWEQIHLTLLNKAIYKPLPSIPNSIAGAPISYQNSPTTYSLPTIKAPEIKKVTEKEQITKRNTDNDSNTARNDNNLAHNENNLAHKEYNLAHNENNLTHNENNLTHNLARNKKLEVIAMKQEEFDQEEYLYVKVKNIYTKITLTSYNTLVQSGTGARYCVLCSKNVFTDDLKAHVNSTEHLKNMEKCNFLKKYERHLLRQMSTRYHCALCNVWLLNSSVNDHILWPTHKETEANKVVKHTRRNEIKTGTTAISRWTQDEIATGNTKNDFEIIANIEFRISGNQDIVKTKIIVKIDGVVLKISWDSFHGICKQKNGYKCLICRTDFKAFGLSAHVENSQHVQILENCFQLEFSPALIRKVNTSTLHCLTCNLQVINDHHSITNHIASKGHVKKYKSMVADKCDSDIDSNDILTLTSSKKS